jgi:excisionase family DNA binding protein
VAVTQESPGKKLHPVDTVVERLGIGRTQVFALMASGEIRSVKIGKRRLVSEAALCEFIDRLDAQAATGGAA